jgi:tetratricopeptide (TPR) repeat protein
VSTSAVKVASPTEGVPLPSDSRIVPPAATAPRDLAALSGVWAGKWDGVGNHVLVVEEVGERDALVSYAWGGTPASPQPGWIRARARFRDGRLTLTSLSQATVTYEAQPDGRLLGVWTLGNQISMVRLSREPAAPVQSAATSAAPAGRARLLGREAWQDLLDGRYADALPKAQQALALSEQQFGPDHLEVAASLNTLGEVYRAHGRFDDAERVHRRALAIREKQLGPADPAVATTLNNLAMLHNARAVYTEAESLLKRALVITERAQETSQQDRRLQAEILENLAKVYRALGRIAEAEEAQGKAMMLWTMQ